MSNKIGADINSLTVNNIHKNSVLDDLHTRLLGVLDDVNDAVNRLEEMANKAVGPIPNEETDKLAAVPTPTHVSGLLHATVDQINSQVKEAFVHIERLSHFV